MLRSNRQKNILITYSAVYYSQKRVFWTLITLSVCFIVAYMYFVGASIVNVVVREEIEQNIQRMRSAISEAETEYLRHRQEINATYAQRAGFVALSEKTYVVKKSVTVLSINQ